MDDTAGGGLKIGNNFPVASTNVIQHKKEKRMNIVLPNNQVITNQQPSVDFVLGDNGGALVSITLTINDSTGIKYRLVHDEDLKGSVSKSLPLPQGTYPCTLVIHAYKQGVLNTTYKSFVSISGNIVASADGSIATGADDDLGYTKFVLTVA